MTVLTSCARRWHDKPTLACFRRIPIRLQEISLLRATFAFSFVFCCSALLAQQGTGTISGIVTASQNAVVGGASVQVTQVETGQAFKTQTNERGFYTAPGLAVGS